MDYKKKVKLKRDFANAQQTLFDKVTNSITDFARDNEKKLNTMVNDNFKKNVYREVLNVIDTLLVNRAAKDKFDGLIIVKDYLDESVLNESVSVQTLVNLSAPKGAKAELLLDNDEFVNNLFDLIRIYLTTEEDLDVVVTEKEITVSIKE